MRYNHESYLPLGAFQPTLGKIKLYGGGGGGILDDFSDAIGTGGGDQGLLNSIDEGVQSLGGAISQVDDFVNEEIPGGWYTVGALAVGGALLGPELLAAEGAGFTGATETGLATLAGEGAATDLAGTTLLGEAGLTGAAESGIGEAFTSPIIDAPISQYELSPKFDLSPNVPIESVSPKFDPTGSLQTPQPTPTYDFSPNTPIEQVSPELDPTGSLANTGITGKNVLDTLRAANTVKNVVKALTPQEQALKNAQTSQQQMNMANLLRGTQMPQTALPPIYKQANPFNFGQQNQPVQDTTALANLLRTA
jgi:hypothetical protein